MDKGGRSKSAFLNGGGETGELTRNFAWGKTSLGESENWPLSLQVIVGAVLHAASPMCLFWGKDMLCFYNDAYKSFLGDDGNHSAIGKAGKEAWPEYWDATLDVLEKVMATGKAITIEDKKLQISRNAKIEKVYGTFSYSPAYGNDHSIDGVLVTCSETTAGVNTLKELQTAQDKIISQEQLISYFEHSPVAIATINKENLTFQLVNTFYAELVGRTPEEIENKPLLEALPELKGQGFDDLLNNVIATGIPFIAEEAAVELKRNGMLETIFVNLTYQPQRNSEKEVTGILVVATDVTQQVRTRKKVEESEEHLQLLRNTVPAMIFYMDAEQRYRSYNGVFMDWFNVNATDALGKTTREFIGETAYQRAAPHLAKAYAGEQVQYHMNAPQRIGGEKWLNIVYTPHKNPEGEVIGVIVHATDITEYVSANQKIEQKEKELRDLITASPIGICVVSGSPLRVEEVNERFLQISGKTRQQYADAPYWEVLNEVAHIFRPVIEGVFATGEKYTTEENEMVLIRNGVPENIYLTFEYIPVFEKNEVTKVIVMVVEVTHQAETRKKIEEAVVERTKELAESNLLLKRSNEELEQFAYIASHDLQEPIRKISTFTQMLEHSIEGINERSKDYISKIYNSADRMSKLVRDVLAFSRVRDEANEFESVDLNTILEAVKVDFELSIEEKQAVVEIANLPTVKAIASQMTQLFGNLMSNALKYRKPGVNPVIKITSSVADENIKEQANLDTHRKYYRIEFSDNGIGFKKEYVDRIFRIFQRLHGKTEYEGTGIGLAICQKIIHNHEGHIFAGIGENGGAVFNMLLPAHE